MAKVSGRGLGHTGGTVDKMESIPGMRTAIPKDEFYDIVNRCNIAVIGQSGNMVPADKKLYALRDVTATIDSVPLIAASIMSKKIAAGSCGIVLDVKTGSGAFMKTLDDSIRLAEKMVAIGTRAGRRCCALITDMDLPLGRKIGNALEVQEACEVLRGTGEKRISALCLELAANMIYLGRQAESPEEAREKAKQAVSSGAAFEKLCDDAVGDYLAGAQFVPFGEAPAAGVSGRQGDRVYQHPHSADGPGGGPARRRDPVPAAEQLCVRR